MIYLYEVHRVVRFIETGTGGCPELVEGEKGKFQFNEYRVSFCDDVKVPAMDSNDCTTL